MKTKTKFKKYASTLSLLLGGVFLMTNCEQKPKDVTFFVWEEEQSMNGRYLSFNPLELKSTFQLDDKTPAFALRSTNLFCHQKKNLKTMSESPENQASKDDLIPIFVHRPTDRIDTLFASKGNEDIEVGIGYISSYLQTGDWLVMECKLPGKILGHSKLADKEQEKNLYILDLTMNNYLYEGQEKVFKSSVVNYWIANIHTNDLYGPFNIKNLKPQLLHLGISLPLQLEGQHDQYAFSPHSNEKLPKAAHWPHQNKREGTLIEK